MRSPLPHQIPYRADIDGLRAIAVLAVVGFHTRPDLLPGGFIGVDIFFVISGFLISSLLLDSAQRGCFSLLDFYNRRIRRIVPALALVLCAVLAAGWLLLLPQDFSDLGKLVISGALFIPNLQLWNQAGYFEGNPATRPLLHLWSLGVEEQFYLLWPWLILAFWKKGLPWVTGALAAGSFLASVFFLSRYPSAVFYFPVTRLWELLAGAFLAWQERRHIHAGLGTVREFSTPWRQALSLSGLVIIAACCLRMNRSLPFPGWWALPAVAGTMMMIGAGASAWANRFLLANPVAVFFGLISYPLYLWHWPILVFLYIWKGGQPSNHLKDGAMVAAVLISWLTYRLLEKPVRSIKSARHAKTAAWTLLAGLAALSVSGAVIIAANGLPMRFPASVRTFLTYTYDKTDSWRYACFLQASQPASDWSASSCLQKQTDPPQPSIVIWGDSHAADLRPGLDALQKNWKFRLDQMTATGCPPFVGADITDRPYCRAENDLFLAEIGKLGPDEVVLSSWWTKYGITGLIPTIRQLKAAHIRRIVVLGPAPDWIEYLPPLLAEIALRSHSPPPASLGREFWSEFPETQLKALADSEHVSYISFTDAMCPQGRCVTMTGPAPQNVTFLDASHLRDPGSQLLLQRIAGQLFAGLGISKR